MKRYIFIAFLSFLINFQIKGQCNALFSDSTSAFPCGVVQFTNLSTGTNSFTNYSWSLPGALTATSNIPNPTATYTANGTYTVCLSIFNASPTCSSSICQTLSINCFSLSCTANFVDSNCVVNGSVAQMSFFNTSPNTNTSSVYNWNFGNSTTSSQQNPTATFTANGIYTVCLTYTNTSPSCTASICQTVNISCVPPPPTPTCQANFTNSPCNNGQMTFFSTSTGTNNSTSYTWYSSPPPSGPPAPYTATVCLTMMNSLPTCSSSVCKNILVDCAGIGFEEFIVEDNKVKIFPNPSNGLFNLDISQINLNSSSFQVKIYNILGELVHQSLNEVQQGRSNNEIDLQSLPNGAYYLRMNADNKACSAKLIITK
ncbi:MAG: T9SS type A sorting domain-containing protein [Bacteroidia bacterium]|nr:T9SS type A sorting domain-containing protein [Sphingobacteriaceae bacterium]MBP9070605.1 T9SS type A sorting domain-containing protein [Bacteroidia bacterium]